MNAESYQKRLISMLESAVSNFNNQLPAVESSLFFAVVSMLKELQVDSKGKIINNTSNLNRLARIKSTLEKSVISEKWVNSVKGLLRSFKNIEALQNEYFSSLDPQFRKGPLLTTITSGAIDATLQSLTEDGIRSQVISKINEQLKQNIISQVSYSSLVESMQLYLKSSADNLGLLSRYAQMFVTDALNQYSASYTQAVAQDLGFQWYMYTGSLLTTSRPWCEHMVDKKYIHESEFPTVLKGKFGSEQVPLNDKTDLPQGMHPDTTIENLTIKRGGYNCGHQFTPVHESAVPDHIKNNLGRKQPPLEHFNDPNNITIHIDSYMKSVINKLGFSEDDLIKLAGGIPLKGLKANYEIHGDEDHIIVSTQNNEYRIVRHIYPGENYIENYLMKVYQNGKGTGLKLFLNQVKEARARGIDRLEVFAAEGPGWNGYVTWGKFGYILEADYQRKFLRLMMENERNEKTLFELLSTKDGESFWEDNGFAFNATFDLSDNSEAIKNFKEYLKKKGLSTDL